nr:hypothetical protein GCM10017611_60740 [Rhodococcus wratislaviensis]
MVFGDIGTHVDRTQQADLVVVPQRSRRPYARIRFDIGPRHGSTTLYWTLVVDEPVPDGETIVRMRKRVNELINANLRFTFGQ